MAESLARMLLRVGVQSLLITSDTSGGDLESEFLASQGACIPKLRTMGIQAIITSPTVTQGFNIKSHTDQIDSVWGFYQGGSITAHAMAQALDRVRSNDIPRFIHVAKKGSAYSKLSKAQTMTAFMKEFQQVSTASARLVRHSLTPEAIVTSDNINWQSSNLTMLASLEVRRNRGMMALRDTLVALLRREGKDVCMMTPSVTANDARSAGEALKTAKQQVNLAHAQAVAHATPIDATEAKRLSSLTTPLTPEQVLSLEQWHVTQFYRLEQIAATDVLFDYKGLTQKSIKKLEQLINPQLATDHTVVTLNHNASTPQDWSRAAVRAWLNEQSGFAGLVREIVAGTVTELSPDRIDQIVGFMRCHAAEFRMAIGRFDLEHTAPQQIIGEMLRRVSIATTRHRKRLADGKVGSIYRVDAVRLAGIVAIIQRRKHADPACLLGGELPQDGSPQKQSHTRENSAVIPPHATLNQGIRTDQDRYGYPICGFGTA
jgi:hypothetical protein